MYADIYGRGAPAKKPTALEEMLPTWRQFQTIAGLRVFLISLIAAVTASVILYRQCRPREGGRRSRSPLVMNIIALTVLSAIFAFVMTAEHFPSH